MSALIFLKSYFSLSLLGRVLNPLIKIVPFSFSKAKITPNTPKINANTKHAIVHTSIIIRLQF